MIICPECKKELANEIKTCPHCGYDIEGNLIKCVECGSMVNINEESCPICGYSKNNFATHKGNKFINLIRNNKKMKYCVIALSAILMIISIISVTSKDFVSYKEHFVECKQGYEEAMELAETERYFTGAYYNIADSYKDLMAHDIKEISLRIAQSALCCGTSVTLLVLVFKKRG